ncbi:uncharacterized protein LOC134006006 [Scomber scombrus]|uniref:uncharacterized protein LOC134006006 n=1 Tax=Scomber scombrus TaxID=13677 RepID=UPI002DD91056|nr:uncharacterized protein LOC134006006 [Scomber scombrus]
MRNFTLTTALLLCSLSWISASEFFTVDVQTGEEVTLLCSNFSSAPTQIFWFRVVKRSSEPHCISFIFQSFMPASFCEGFQNDKFEMSTNLSTIFLKIKQVNLTDSGLYFCGYKISKSPVIVSATYLEVQESGVILMLTSVILGGLTTVLVMVIIGLLLKIRKRKTAHIEELNLHQTESPECNDLNYAAVTFHPKDGRNHRPASEREADGQVIYSATR